jgi:predicted DNA-binding transcriptional regulator AlpA
LTKDHDVRLASLASPLNAVMPGDTILSGRETSRITGLSLTTIWRERRHKRFPEPVQLSTNRKGFLTSEVYRWLQARVDAARTEGK